MSTPSIDLSINTDLVRNLLTGFIRNEINRAGYSRAVLGLSGGLDSALACYLAVEALGKENVLAVIMPYKTTNPESLFHAQMIIDKLGVQSLTIPITDMVQPLMDRYPNASRVRCGNMMARARMIVLYDQSEEFHGLVVGTGNKTEILLGYSTQFGDSACALNPLGDLYKTQIRQLSAALGIPPEIIQKPPSADLWVGQTDEGELGFSYDDVDRLLYLLVDQHNSPQGCIQAGFTEKFVDIVIKRIQRSYFKRIMPPIAKISNHKVGDDLSHLNE